MHHYHNDHLARRKTERATAVYTYVICSLAIMLLLAAGAAAAAAVCLIYSSSFHQSHPEWQWARCVSVNHGCLNGRFNSRVLNKEVFETIPGRYYNSTFIYMSIVDLNINIVVRWIEPPTAAAVSSFLFARIVLMF